MSRTASRPLLLTALLALLACGLAQAGNWPQWRGPTGDGVSAETGLPLKWSNDSGLLWKFPLDGPASSSPIVWGDAAFLTTQEGDNLSLVKINVKTGQAEWTQKVGSGETPRAPLKAKSADERRHQKFHDLQNLASPTPATDGEIVVVHFGNGDLAAYDYAGKQLWRHNLQDDYGTYTIWWGHANSPIIYKDLVVNVCMQDSLSDLPGSPVESYLVAFDKRTGQVRWKTARPTKASAEECDAYTTPVVRTVGNRQELVVMGGNQLDAYDPDTGKQLWYLPGLVGGRTVTGPTLADGLVFATRGMKKPLVAVRPEGSGELPEKDIVWQATQNTPDASSPVAWKGLLFWTTDNGFAFCCDAKTGEVKWNEQRLNGDFKASPVAADGRVYFLDRAGRCTVTAASDKFEQLAVNSLDGDTNASPAFAGGRIYIRTSKALYCVGAK
jgi:outer membrane protein assembly factor BamB